MINRSGIYKITCVTTGKFYVGSATLIKKRWREHKKAAKTGNHHNKYFQNAWNKHGEQDFKFEILLVCRKEDLIMYEQMAIDVLRPHINICRTAGNTAGRKLSQEARARISTKNKGHKRNLGRVMPEEEKVKLRLRTMEQLRKYGHPMKGKFHNDSTKKKISEANKGNSSSRGRKASVETRARISMSMQGHKRCVGRVLSAATKRKIGDGNRGKKHTAEHIAKTSAAPKKPVSVGGVRYVSMAAASEAVGKCVKTFRKWAVAGSVPQGNGELSGVEIVRHGLTVETGCVKKVAV